MRGLRPYFIANSDFIYGIVKNAKRIIIYNRELEFVRDIYYDDNYDKVFFNTNGSLITLRHGRFLSILIN